MLTFFTLCIKNIKKTNKLLHGEKNKKKTKLLYGDLWDTQYNVH